MADATTRTMLFASCNAAVDDRELFLGSIAIIERHSFGEASRHDAVGRRRTIRSLVGRLITEREREIEIEIERDRERERERERESSFPSLVEENSSLSLIVDKRVLHVAR